MKILGISASLRNARKGVGNKALIADILAIPDKKGLFNYIKKSGQDHLENFLQAGRKDGIPFDKMYKNLKKSKGNKGLSNSEIALTSALWSASKLGAEIEHISLAEYFSESETTNKIADLKQKLIDADGIIISTPVYFGDRGSLSQSLIELIRSDKKLIDKLKGKVYAGIAVGAKRNGGQETTLIYQLLDMVNIGLLGVGNDSETTSQYGGTGLAGDIGTMSDDSYGLETVMGTGRRVARVANMIANVKQKQLKGKHKVVYWILQDKADFALNYIKSLVKTNSLNSESIIIDVGNKHIIRCLACDICPTKIDLDEEYRCIIKNKKDDLEDLHQYFLDADAIIPVALSVKNTLNLKSNYQRFIERTRYIRRGDYVMSDVITTPIILEELGAGENLAIRVVTSMIRHHTIISKPIVAYLRNKEVLNTEQVVADFLNLNTTIRNAAKARLVAYASKIDHLKYKPVGYILSASKDKEDEKLLKRSEMIKNRTERNSKMANKRLGNNE